MGSARGHPSHPLGTEGVVTPPPLQDRPRSPPSPNLQPHNHDAPSLCPTHPSTWQAPAGPPARPQKTCKPYTPKRYPPEYVVTSWRNDGASLRGGHLKPRPSKKGTAWSHGPWNTMCLHAQGGFRGWG